MSTHIPKAGDTVYSIDGAMALYVSTAKGGGYIVQPLIEDGDGYSEPRGHYADGVEIWHSVYPEPPQPKLAAEIQAQQERLTALRAEVAELERTKREADSQAKALKERLAMHQALAALDDLLSGRITHYLIDVSENSNGRWQVVPSSEFFKLRTHYSVVSLRLWANLNDSRSSVQWRFSPNAERHEREGRAYAFTSEADAVAKLHEIVAAELQDTAKHASNAYWLRQRAQWCAAQGVPVPAEISARLFELERAEAEFERKKAQDAMQAAEAKLAALAA